MKKYISLLLIAILTMTAFVGCTTKPSLSKAIRWKEEDIELQNILPELKSKFVNETNDIVIELVDSPFVFTPEEILAKLKNSASFKDCSFTTKTEEIGAKQTTGGIAINLLDTIYCYKNNESSPYFHIDITRCLPTTVNINSVHIYISETPAKDLPVQEQWSELFNIVFGEEIGHAMLYARDKDTLSDDRSKNMLHEKVMSDYTGHYYTVYRNVEEYDDGKITGDFQLNISSGAVNTYPVYKGDYKPVAKTFKYNASELFDRRLGEQTDIFATDIFNRYMSIGKREEDGDNFGRTVLNEYSYSTAIGLNGEHIYESSSDFCQYTGPDFASSVKNSANLSITFSVTEDMNEKISDYSYHISGKSRDIDKAETPEEVLNEKEEKLEKILEDIKDQLVLVFGDGINVSELTINDFEIANSEGAPHPLDDPGVIQTKTDMEKVSPSYLASYNYDFGESYGYLGEIKRTANVPAIFNFYGETQSVTVSIQLASNLDKWSGSWSFDYAGK